MTHPIENLSPIPVQIEWHEKKRVYLSFRKTPRCLYLQLHQLFFDAPTPVLEALLDYALGRNPKAIIVIRQMAHLYFANHTSRAPSLSPVGKVYNLQEIFNALLPQVPIQDVSIGWSNRKKAAGLRSILYGSYDMHTRQIRINPILDEREVPLYFLEFVVYHEMLHALYPSYMDGKGRCQAHTKEFREKERQFPRFKEAKIWGEKGLTLLKRITHGRA